MYFFPIDIYCVSELRAYHNEKDNSSYSIAVSIVMDIEMAGKSSTHILNKNINVTCKVLVQCLS